MIRKIRKGIRRGRSYLWNNEFSYLIVQRLYSNYYSSIDFDPLETFWLDPNSITHTVGNIQSAAPPSYHAEYINRPMDFPDCVGAVCGGDWDNLGSPVSEFFAHESYHNHFLDDLPWTQTQFFKVHADRISEHSYSFGCSSTEELLEKLQSYDSLFRRLAEEGFKQQTELREHPFHGVNVCLARDGTPMYYGHGRNRLILAQVLDLPRIPVNVTLRHRENLAPKPE